MCRTSSKKNAHKLFLLMKTPKEPIHKFFAFFHVQFLKIIYLCQKIKSNNNNNQVLVPIFPNKLKYTKNEIQSELQFE